MCGTSASTCVIVAMVNMKGGGGKSTLTANAGWFCACRANSRAPVVDLDPQFNLIQFALGNDQNEKGITKKG